jgi:hypothetical protein
MDSVSWGGQAMIVAMSMKGTYWARILMIEIYWLC